MNNEENVKVEVIPSLQCTECKSFNVIKVDEGASKQWFCNSCNSLKLDDKEPYKAILVHQLLKCRSVYPCDFGKMEHKTSGSKRKNKKVKKRSVAEIRIRKARNKTGWEANHVKKTYSNDIFFIFSVLRQQGWHSLAIQDQGHEWKSRILPPGP